MVAPEPSFEELFPSFEMVEYSTIIIIVVTISSFPKFI